MTQLPPNKTYKKLLLLIFLLVTLITITSSAENIRLSASSGQGELIATKAMDGKTDTRWSSDFDDNQWLQLDFESPKKLVGLKIHWETAYGRDYEIMVRQSDGKWKTVSHVKFGDGGLDEIYFGPRKIKTLRIKGNKRGTGWGYSIWEIELLGTEHQIFAKSNSSEKNRPAENVLDGDKKTYWQSKPVENEQTELELVFPKKFNIGGLQISWAQQHAAACKIQVFSEQTGKWKNLMNKKAGVNNSEDLFFVPIEIDKLRFVFSADSAEPIRISDIQIKGASEGWSPVRHFEMLAGRLADGLFPGWLRREQTFWTVTGLDKSFNESLIDEYGKIETGLRSFSVTPALLIDNQFISAKNFKTTQSLLGGWAPIPTVEWLGNGLKINITANTIKPDTTIVLYKIANTTNKTKDVSLLMAARPLQINPPWQHGGYAGITNAEWQKNKLQINQKNAASFYPSPSFCSLYSQNPKKDSIDILEYLRDNLTDNNSISSNDGIISAGLRYDYKLKAGQTKVVLAVYPNSDNADITVDEKFEDFFEKEKQKSFALWQKLTGDWAIDVPNDRISNIVRSNLAYLLINADGQATQPGSRNYNSSWIRDGAISATAMMRFGLIDRGLNYTKWISNLIKEDGFVPFIVNTQSGQSEGFAGNWAEYDSFGQYIFLARQAIEITDDNKLAELCWPKIRAVIKYMKNLRNQRLTDEYKGTEYEGILPQSQSHEGYIDPPRHSYWDDFFALKGLQDAGVIALRLNKTEEARRLAKFEKEFRKSVLKSIEKVREIHNLNVLPGCAELGDFDPTSTAIGIMVADERDNLNAKALKASFDRYMKDSKNRANMPVGTRPTYTPYEVRNISAMIRLGRIDDATMLTDFFIDDAVRPANWNQMGEVVHGDLRTPSYIGDMPHTWVGAGFINAIRDMFVYEERGKLILAAGVPDKWLDKGIAVKNLQTWYGPISYNLKREQNGKILLKLEYSKEPPNGFATAKGVKLILKKNARTDKEYLAKLYKATFDCINYFSDNKTGLPYDINSSTGITSTTNIGFYMASVAIAAETGLIEKEKAIKKISKTFDSLEKIQKWHGFPVTWVDIQTITTANEPSFSYADHIGNLICGLLVTAATFPEQFGQRVDDFISIMDFESTYDTETGWLKGGYNLSKKDFDINQPFGKWYYNFLASDTRAFSLAAISAEKIPAQHWHRLKRQKIQDKIEDKLDIEIVNMLKNKADYLYPGMLGGGLFMQYIAGIFIDEKNCQISQSAANLANAQIELARNNYTLPFWGISSCQSPDDKSYIGWANLDKFVITPHACVLAIQDFPVYAVKNLKALEENNARPLYKDTKTGKLYDFGFTDSFNVTTKQVCSKYLILDQSMLFLSLANYLHSDIVRTKFNDSSLGKKMNKTLRQLESKGQ